MVDRRSELLRLRATLAGQFPELKRLPPEVDLGDDSPGLKRSDSPIELVREQQKPELFGYQLDLASQMGDVLAKRGRGLVALPTGGGKTRTAVASILNALSSGSVHRVVWLAPSVELLDQATLMFEILWRECGAAPDLMLCRKIEDVPTAGNCLLVTTPQAIYARGRRKKRFPKSWDAVVFDEAHQLGAATFKAAVAELLKSDQRISLIGLSATPGRVNSDETEDLVNLFDGQLLVSSQLRSNPVEKLQRWGVLSRLEFESVPWSIGTLQSEADRIANVARLAADLGSAKSHVLAFTTSVAGAMVLAEIVSSLGVEAHAVYASMPDSARIELISSYSKGDFQVLTNQKLLATGYDCPAISDLILEGRVGSSILFEQMVGRAARGPMTGGSRHSTIWQNYDHLQLHGLPSSYYRFRDFDWRQNGPGGPQLG